MQPRQMLQVPKAEIQSSLAVNGLFSHEISIQTTNIGVQNLLWIKLNVRNSVLKKNKKEMSLFSTDVLYLTSSDRSCHFSWWNQSWTRLSSTLLPASWQTEGRLVPDALLLVRKNCATLLPSLRSGRLRRFRNHVSFSQNETEEL